MPKLKFPNFYNRWNEYDYNQIGRIITGNTPSTKNEKFYGGDHLFISPGDINEARYITTSKTHLTDLGFAKGRKIPKESVLIVCIGSTIGKVAQVKQECVTNQQINSVILNPAFDPGFVYYATTKISNKIKLIAGIQAVPIISKTQFGKIKIFAPDLNEQKQIARFLGVVDRRLELLTQKKVKLEEYKKGIMQQIFSQKIRFTKIDGTSHPDWELQNIRNLGVFVSTNSLSRANLNYKSGNLLNIHYGDIHTKFRLLFYLENETLPYINIGNEPKYTDESFLQKGDIIIADASENLNDIGRVIEIVSTGGEKIVSGLHTFIFRPRQKFATGFLGHIFSSSSIRRNLQKIAVGAKVLGISKSGFSNIEISIPTVDEQKKIADFLTSIDKSIELVGKQLEATKQYKKALLQQMLV